jgi:hypothetical protein
MAQPPGRLFALLAVALAVMLQLGLVVVVVVVFVVVLGGRLGTRLRLGLRRFPFDAGLGRVASTLLPPSPSPLASFATLPLGLGLALGLRCAGWLAGQHLFKILLCRSRVGRHRLDRRGFGLGVRTFLGPPRPFARPSPPAFLATPTPLATFTRLSLSRLRFLALRRGRRLIGRLRLGDFSRLVSAFRGIQEHRIRKLDEL